MSVIKFTALGGLEPSVPPRALPETGAQLANNINPGSPTFRALLGDKPVSTVAVSNPKTLYRFDRKADGSLNTDETTGWKASPTLLNLARTQIDDDTTGKIYYTPADGATPMYWHNAAGQDRQVGVPAPTAAPTITSINDSYVFTPDVRSSELDAVLTQAVKAVKDLATLAWVGPDGSLPQGWVRRSDFVPPTDPGYAAARREVVRVFAVHTSTNAVLSTFTDMPTDESAWVFDQTLGGSYYTLPAGVTPPAWATGYTKFWTIPMRAFAQAYDVPPVATKAALLTLKMPGTQGAQPLLTSTQADAIVTQITEHGDKDSMRVKSKIDALRAKVDDTAAIFTTGGRASLAKQTELFYQRADVQATLASAQNDFAEAIWGYVRMLGVATAPPFYQDYGGA